MERTCNYSSFIWWSWSWTVLELRNGRTNVYPWQKWNDGLVNLTKFKSQTVLDQPHLINYATFARRPSHAL